MNAYATPAAAGRPAGPFAPDRRDWLRLLGGVVVASGALVLAVRKSSEWSEWALLFTFLIPCVLLYGLAFAAHRVWPALQGWQSAFLAFAVLLLPLVFLQFISAVHGDTGSRLNVAWIFALSAAVAVVAALRLGAWWQMFIAGVYAIVAWTAFWAKVLDNPSADTIRALLIVVAAILLAAGLVLGRMERPGSSDLITVAGIAAVLAGAISLAGLSSNASQVSDLITNNLPRPSTGWNIYMFVVSLALIGYGARSRTRGPAYVGAIGLTVFIGLTGANVVARLKGDDPSAVVGWPLVLLLGGAALLAAHLPVPPAGPHPRADGAAAGRTRGDRRPGRARSGARWPAPAGLRAAGAAG